MTRTARVTIDETSCPAQEQTIPHVGGPLRNASPVCLESDGQRIVRLGDHAACHTPALPDTVIEGAATFTVCGIPVARLDDGTVHLGHIAAGSPHFTVGGPKFKMPSNFKLVGGPDFVNKTIRDIYKLSTTKTGQEVLDRLAKSRQPVTIREWVGGQNALTKPVNLGDAQQWRPTGSTIWYNPDFETTVVDAAGHVLAEPPTVLLGHELVHAVHNAEGAHAWSEDPNPPRSEPAHLDGGVADHRDGQHGRGEPQRELPPGGAGAGPP